MYNVSITFYSIKKIIAYINEIKLEKIYFLQFSACDCPFFFQRIASEASYHIIGIYPVCSGIILKNA